MRGYLCLNERRFWISFFFFTSLGFRLRISSPVRTAALFCFVNAKFLGSILLPVPEIPIPSPVTNCQRCRKHSGPQALTTLSFKQPLALGPVFEHRSLNSWKNRCSKRAQLGLMKGDSDGCSPAWHVVISLHSWTLGRAGVAQPCVPWPPHSRCLSARPWGGLAAVWARPGREGWDGQQ